MNLGGVIFFGAVPAAQRRGIQVIDAEREILAEGAIEYDETRQGNARRIDFHVEAVGQIGVRAAVHHSPRASKLR